MNPCAPDPRYPRHMPSPSSRGRAEFVGTIYDIDAEFVGTIYDIDVWWDPVDREYWYNIPGDTNAWVGAGKEPHRERLKPAFPLAEAHRLLANP